MRDVGGGAGRVRGAGERQPDDLTAPPVAPAAMKRCAARSSTIAGSDASTAVALTVLQSAVYVPMYW